MILATFRKELAVLWATPLPWVGGALLHALLGALYVTELEARGQALFQPAVPLIAFLLLILAPVLTMRAVAEEARSGTLDLLLSTPATPGRVVLGKWLASLATSTLVLVPFAATLAVIERFGDLDPGGVLAASAGLVLFAAAITAVGVAASALTTSQPLAGLAAFVATLALWFAASTPGSTGAGGLLSRISLSERLATFAAGGVDTGDAVFFCAVSAIGVAVGAGAVRRRRAPARSGPALVSRVGAVAGTAALLFVSAAAVVAADANRRLLDPTTGDALTLSPATQAIVAALDGEVAVTAYVARQDPGRVSVASLLTRYRRANGRVSFRVVDPAELAGEVRTLGIDPVFGGIVVRQGPRVEIARTPTEQDITAAIARVVRNDVPRVCFLSGHGEPSVTDTGDGGLSQLRGALEGVGFEVTPASVAGPAGGFDGCDALVVAAPSGALGDAALDALEEYVRSEGRLLLLTDPASEQTWSAVLDPFGLGLERGIAFELDPSHSFPDDPTRPIVLQYRTAHPIGVRLPPTFYPGAQAITVDPPSGAGVTVEAIAVTTERSYLETTPLEAAFDEGVDRRGPLALVVAGDRSSSLRGEVVRARVVVTADVDVATNAFIGEAGNSALLVRSVEWLTEDPDIVSVRANLALVRPLALTDARLRYLRVLTIGIIPGLFLALGGLGWAVRRLR